MKRISALILVSLIILSAVSCGQSGSAAPDAPQDPAADAPAAEETAAETEPSYLDTLGPKDFGGEKFVYAASQQGTLPAFATELNGEVVNDALFERDRAVSEMYNVVIENRAVEDSPNTANDINNSVMAGDYYCDLYNDALSNGKSYMGSAFQKGSLYNLLDVPYLTLDSRRWSSLLYDQLQYNGKMFFTAGDIATASFYSPSCLFTNLAVAGNHQIDVNGIYRLVYDGAWTADEVMERTKGVQADLNGDGVMKTADDAYGIVSATVELTSTQICVGAGIKYCEKDGDGRLTVELNNEKTLAVLDKLRQCFCEVTSKDDWSPIFETFKNDTILFLVHFVGTSISYRDMDSDFTILPMPKYDAAQESYMSYTNPHAHSYLAIPLIQKDIERTGFVTEVLEYMSVENVRPTIYDVTYKGKVSRNDDSARMLDIIFDTTYIDFNALCSLGGSTQILCDALFAGKEFVSAYEKKADSINKQLEALMALFE